MTVGRYSEMLKSLETQRQNVNNGTMAGGAATVLSDVIRGWLAGKDMRQQQEASNVLSEAFGGQPERAAPKGLIGNIKGALGIGGQPQAVTPLSQRIGAAPDYGAITARMAELGARGNPYAADYALQFGVKQAEDAASKRRLDEERAYKDQMMARDDARWQQQFGLEKQQFDLRKAEMERGEQESWGAPVEVVGQDGATQLVRFGSRGGVQPVSGYGVPQPSAAGGMYADSKNIEGMHYNVLTTVGQKIASGTATPQEQADYTVAYRELSRPKYSRVDDGKGGFNLVPVDQGTDLAGFPVPPQLFGGGQQVAAQGEKLTPAGLTQFVIGQESSGDPNAIGPETSGGRGRAIGLMQLMPATAKEMAGELKLPFSKELLRDPQYNQILGEAYLEKMHREFNGSTPLALAAYNAGPGRVREWIGKFGDPTKGQISEVDFVAQIPFSETKNYVTKILNNFLRAQPRPTEVAASAPPAPAGAMSVPTAPLGANSAPPAPEGWNRAPAAPPGWQSAPPAPQGADRAPPAPPGWNAAPPAPAGANTVPPAPAGAMLTPQRGAPGVISVPNPRASEAEALKQQQTDMDLSVFDNAITGARKILQDPGAMTTGLFGGLAKNIGGTDAKALNDYYDVLRSKIGMMALKDLKEASATGASGLGAMSEKELDMLQSQLGKLDVASSVEQQKATLDAIDRYLAAKRGGGAAAAPAGDIQSEFEARMRKYQ